jgi:hypothetical protein
MTMVENGISFLGSLFTNINIASLAAAVGIGFAAINLHLTDKTIKANTINQAHRTSTTLMQDYYRMKMEKKKSLTKGFDNELDAYYILFLAEAIFIMNKVLNPDAAWNVTVEFLVKDTMVLRKEDIPWDTYDPSFADKAKVLYEAGKDNVYLVPERKPLFLSFLPKGEIL